MSPKKNTLRAASCGENFTRSHLRIFAVFAVDLNGKVSGMTYIIMNSVQMLKEFGPASRVI